MRRSSVGVWPGDIIDREVSGVHGTIQCHCPGDACRSSASDRSHCGAGDTDTGSHSRVPALCDYATGSHCICNTGFERDAACPAEPNADNPHFRGVRAAAHENAIASQGIDPRTNVHVHSPHAHPYGRSIHPGSSSTH